MKDNKTLQINNFLDRNLLKVQKPGRYVGGELNQVTKDWEDIPNHIGLIFPDLYDLGISNLGISILYDTLNQREDTLAERAYMPWVDMEELLRTHQIPLYSLESKKPLKDFDILGFTLPYESLYTNVLTILDLSGIPLNSENRLSEDPLIIAGGHAVYNPEPMADYIDAFVIGEGEEVIHEVINCYQNWKLNKKSRDDLLFKLAQIEGVYVPRFYLPVYNPDKTLKEIKPIKAGIPETIQKRITPVLPPPPTNVLVPMIDVVHNRVAIEIMRGCTRGCRYCHAGMINRPVRERSVDEILEAIEKSLDSTGYEEVSLLSLSSSDYSHILELVQKIRDRFDSEHLNVSLPSLRIESFSIDLLQKLKNSRAGGFTLAPEAGSDHIRNKINKPISSQQLLDTAAEIYRRGWTTIKLYFMIGLPGESIDDVKEIIELSHKVIKMGRGIIGGRAKLNVSVGTFVPKPHTPFQWVPCDTLEQIEAKQTLLKQTLRGKGIKLSWSDPQSTFFEAWLSRGDRRLGRVIYEAWKNGARFDAWKDQFQYQLWQDAFLRAELDPNFYSHRERADDEVFAWDHIDSGIRKNYLLEEYNLSKEGLTREDCREKCHGCGITSTFKNIFNSENSIDLSCPFPN
ncbi:MAG: TIGR03960 family B12-binding radical SAM protein [Anaerolineaceae bacterium]|nr:TIGR03960 family B12-binding radical SAM protein [Anaerolineaceae bacterium]